MVHALIAVLCCLILPPFLYPVVAGFYIGREFAQAEYRVIEHYYSRHRDWMDWYDPFLPRAWNAKSFLDWFLPTIVVVGFMLWNFTEVAPIWWRFLKKLFWA